MKKFGDKLSLSRATLRMVADGLSAVGGGSEPTNSGMQTCGISCPGNSCWDSDVVKGKEGGGGKEGK